jgi:ATP-dependent protease ClpP protease subunit
MMKKLLILLMLLSFGSFGRVITLEKGDFFTFSGEVNASTVSTSMKDLLFLLDERENYVESKPLYLILDTPGGEVTSGNQFIETITSLEQPVDSIVIFAASMGFHFTQNTNKRYIVNSGVLMSHKMRGGVEGEFGQPDSQLDKRYELWKGISRRMDEAVVKKNGKMNLEQYWKLVENEYWCEGQKCVNDGFADEVVQVRCGKTLKGSSEFKASLSFMGMPITVTAKKPNCPLFPMYDIDVKFGNEKKALADTTPEVKARVEKFFKLK